MKATHIIQGRKTGTDLWRWLVTPRGALTMDQDKAVVLPQVEAEAMAEELNAQNQDYEFAAVEKP